MNLITLFKKCLNNTQKGYSYNNNFVIRIKNNIKKYQLTKFNIVIGEDHIELPIVLKFNEVYVLISDDNDDVLNLNVKLYLQDKFGKQLRDEYGFNDSIHKGETYINITENLINFNKTF